MILLLGSLFVFAAGIGIVRLPDPLCRAHALSKAATFGLSLILLEMFFVIGTFSAAIKILLAIAFQMITLPISAHIFALYASQYQKKK